MFTKVVFQFIINKNNMNKRYYYNIPFFNLYERSTGESMDNNILQSLKKKHPNIEKISVEQLNCSLQILKKFGISELDACRNPHILIMNPITMDNYGEILKECGFTSFTPKYIIRYHTIVRSRTISQLKRSSLIPNNEDIEERLLKCFTVWPLTHKISNKCLESTTSLLNIRMKILQLYLNWRLDVSEEEFEKYCQLYLPLKHKPMSDIQAAVDLAENDFKIDPNVIKRNGFIIAADPLNTKLIVENVTSLAGLDIKQVVRIEPAILKTNYKALLQIRNILEEYRISEEAQRKCLKIYCLSPKTVQERLQELMEIKELQVFVTNPRVLNMVVHKRKMLARLDKIQAVSKQCYSLNHLVTSSKVFNNYINNFGNKVCSRDIVTLICSSLNVNNLMTQDDSTLRTKKIKFVAGTNINKELFKYVLDQLRRHTYWLNVALSIVDKNIKMLKEHFSDEVIVRHCHLLMYPMSEILVYLNIILEKRNNTLGREHKLKWDNNYNNVDFEKLTDCQILSLILYELEKKYHFTGDGIWSIEQQKVSKQSSG